MLRRMLGIAVMAAIVAAGWPMPARAALNATAQLTAQQLNANSWEYSITLNNTGTTDIGTYWFAWIPNYDFLPSAPTQIVAPNGGWTPYVVQDGFLGGYSLEWVATTALAAGQSLSGFKFDTPDSPSVIDGISNFAGLPVETSYVYIGGSQLDPGHEFATQTATPEPAGLGVVMVAAGLLGRRKRR